MFINKKSSLHTISNVIITGGIEPGKPINPIHQQFVYIAMMKQPKTNNRSQLDVCCSCVSSQLTFNTPNQKVPINKQTGIRGVIAKWFYLNLYSEARVVWLAQC